MPERKAVERRRARVRQMMSTLPPNAQEAIRDDLEGTHKYHSTQFASMDDGRHEDGDEAPTGRIPVSRER